MARSETLTRVAVALAGIPVAGAAIWFGGWVLAALLAAMAAVSALELFRMAGLKGPLPLTLLGAGGAALLVAATAVEPQRGLDTPLPGALVTLLVLAALTAAIWLRGVQGEPLLSVSVTVLGAVYPALLGFALFLRHLPGVESRLHGALLLFAPVLMTWASDTFAYFSGRMFGRRKLIPNVSPGKTVAGAVGALAGTVLVSVVYSFLLARFPVYGLTIIQAAAFGALMSVSAQVGDLAESLVKRDAGVKDSGSLLPGHGGALDRFDSLFFTLPIAYAFFRLVAGA